MENCNHLSDRAIKTGKNAIGLDYLVTGDIPQFSFDGSTSFTIGTQVLLLDTNNDSSIYRKEGVIDIGFDELNLYFKSQFCEFKTTKDEIDFQVNTWYSITVSYDLEVISLYVNGIKAIEYKQNTTNPISANDHYDIGHNLFGYIKSVYVYNVCLTDDNILQNYNHSLCKTDNLVAWFDFTEGEDPRDKSKNHIAIHEGRNSTVTISNIARCLRLTGNGYSQSDCSNITYQNYSLLTKLYINKNYDDLPSYVFSNADMSYVSGLSLFLEKKTKSSFTIVCTINSKNKGVIQLKSIETINAEEWVDIGLTCQNNTLSLYVNGEFDTSLVGVEPLDIEGDGIRIIGAILNNNTAINFFKGSISYLCEFSKALTVDDFKRYIVNPPYVFSGHLQSLFYFLDTNQIELVSGDNYRLAGDASISILDESQATSVANTVTIEIDNDGCKAWDEYNSNERWEIQLFATTIESYLQIAGLTAPVDSGWYTTPAVAQYFNNAIKNDSAFQSLLEIGPNLSSSDVVSFLAKEPKVLSNISLLLPAAAGAATSAAVAASATTAAITSAALLELILPGLCAAVCTALAIKIVSLIIDELINRPKPDPVPPDNESITILLNGINFIIDGDAKNGAINITKDGVNPIDARKQDAACYVVNKIKDIPQIEIEVQCVYSSKSPITVILIGTESILKDGTPEPSGKLLGDIKSDPFSISQGETKTITVSLLNNQLKNTLKIRNTSTNWYWTYECEGEVEFAENSEQKIFTILDIPLAPWKYQDEGSNLPWTEILDIAADWINKDNTADLSEDVMCEKLTVGVNSCGLKFNTDTGIPAYIKTPTAENTNLGFDMYSFKNNYTADPKSFPEQGGSSLDCSILLATLARLYGISMNQVTLSGGKFNQGFYINPVKPIGFETWENPYANNNSNHTGFLGYQCIAVRKDASNSDAWYNLLVYDSCFKLKSSSGEEVLPVKMQLATSTSTQVVASSDANSYRGQLVLQEENNYVQMPMTTVWSLLTKEPDKPANTINFVKMEI